LQFVPRMTIRGLVLAAVVAALAGCGEPSSGAAPGECDHDGCVVPLAEVAAVCGPSLHAASTDCPGTKVQTGTCGDVTHLRITTVSPIQDCYFTTTSGQLVGAIVRSDSGFTKLAGAVPTEECPATTLACDHTPPTN
jgi:hypothetical protein